MALMGPILQNWAGNDRFFSKSIFYRTVNNLKRYLQAWDGQVGNFCSAAEFGTNDILRFIRYLVAYKCLI